MPDAFFLYGCDKPLEDTSELPLAIKFLEVERRLQPQTLPLDQTSMYGFEDAKLSNRQVAFCNNLDSTKLETKGKFDSWIAKVSSVSIYANGKIKLELLTPCAKLMSAPDWEIDQNDPIYSQLKQFEKGSFVFVSGDYELVRGVNTGQPSIPTFLVQISYLTKSWSK